MTFDPVWKVNMRTEAAKREARRAMFEAVRDVFELDIKADAKRGSPVLTGHNRRTIDTEVGEVPQGVKAELFTQSGYGGYLEIGTKFMKAMPYMWPAFNKHRAKLFQILGIKIAAIKPSVVRALQLKLFKEPPEAK